MPHHCPSVARLSATPTLQAPDRPSTRLQLHSSLAGGGDEGVPSGQGLERLPF